MRPVTWEVTCESCPYQVEGKLDDGRFFYLRHRHCRASLGVGSSPMGAVEDSFTCVVTYHEDNAPECPCNGFCSGLYGEEIAYVWQMLAAMRETD